MHIVPYTTRKQSAGTSTSRQIQQDEPINLNDTTEITALLRVTRTMFHLSARNIQNNCRINFKMDPNREGDSFQNTRFPQIKAAVRFATPWLSFPTPHSPESWHVQTGKLRQAVLPGGATPHSLSPSSNYAHSWATLIICSMCLNNALAFFTWQAGSHCPMGRRSTQSRLAAAGSPGTGEVLCRPRSTLFRWTILLLSADHDPVTYRPKMNNSGSISPVPFGNLNRPKSTALLHKTNGVVSFCSCP